MNFREPRSSCAPFRFRTNRPSTPRMLVLFLLAVLVAGEAPAQPQPTLRVEARGASEEEISRMFEGLDPSRIPTGLLHDQVGTSLDVTKFDGSESVARSTIDTWRQLYHELSRSGLSRDAVRSARGGRRVPGLAGIEEINEMARRYLDDDVIPLALMDVAFNKIRPDALDGGLLRFENGRLVETPAETVNGRPIGPATSLYTSHRAFTVAAFRERTTGRRVRFILPGELYVARGRTRASRLRIDFGDGVGERTLRPGQYVDVTYGEAGTKTITLTTTTDGDVATASTTILVADTTIPSPDLTWSAASAKRSFKGTAASYDAHFFFGAANAVLTRPVVFVEGFDPYYSDPAKRRTWQDIYEILLQEEFVNRLRALGYDVVIMKLGNATDYVQRNAFALEDLLNRLSAAMPPGEEIVVVGPSMGGLIGRYALAFMERNNLPHRARLFVSLDAPHDAANFPLGIQHFLEFFAGDSEVAWIGRNAINSPAARQMLAYQYRAFPNVDPLRAALMSELDLYGFPSTRNIAVANGSGEGLPQMGNELVGFRAMQPGDKIVAYRYRSWFVDIDGDVWALPNGSPETRIFEGLKNVLGPQYRGLDVYVSGTLPYDNTPGGTRGTQQQIADSKAQYGDIRTAFPDHSWIPTTSALMLATPNLSYHVAADPDGLTTPYFSGKRSTGSFDAIYYPSENQEHVFATNENVRFVLDEIDTHFRSNSVVSASRTFNSGQRLVIADNVVVQFLSDVTIDPGVDVVLGANAKMVFHGRVTARGSAAAAIRFIRGGPSAWKWLDLRADQNLFEYAVFDGGDKTIEIRSKNNVFRYCEFRNGLRGVSSNYTMAGERSSFSLEHSLVTDNRSVGVVAYHADAAFKYTTVRRSGQAGIYFYDANTTLFHQSVVEKNALVSTTRSGIEVLGGSYVYLFGPGGGRGYTRVSDNTFHEINVSSSASGLQLGLQGYGGYNSVFDLNEGSSAATEMLVNSYKTSTIFANATYWGGKVPGSADLRGSFSLGTVLFSDPTLNAGAPLPAVAAQFESTALSIAGGPARAIGTGGDSGIQSGTLDRGSNPAETGSGQSKGLRDRMREIRRSLQQDRHSAANPDLLQELYMLQRVDPNDELGELTMNRTVISEWRERLKRIRREEISAERRTAEVAVLLEIRDALLGEQYRAAEALARDYAPQVMSPDLHLRLLLDQISLYEHEERFTEALAILDEIEGSRSSRSWEEPDGLYDIIRDELEEKSLERPMTKNGAQIAEPESPDSAGTRTFALHSAYPNPFNATTLIPFEVVERGRVRIEVYDVLGRRVETIVNGVYNAGIHRAVFDAESLGSGVYLVRAEIVSDGGRAAALSQRVTLLK